MSLTNDFPTATNKPVMTTLAIGADYVKALQKCLDSKQAYADKHGYTYILGSEQFWDRHKPIAWSKIPFLLDVCARVPEGTLIWQSDADVLITNPEKTIEQQLGAHLPEGKDMLMSLDACGHINSGNILFRNTAWARSFWQRVNEHTQFTYHPWWENAAMICIWENYQEDFDKIQISRAHKDFNAYLRGLPDEPLWTPGDFLVHFAGVYDLKAMETYADQCLAGETPRIPMQQGELEPCYASRFQYVESIKNRSPTA